ncbi:hypothetical protein OW867_25460 [Klebsiella pneumoniae]
MAAKNKAVEPEETVVQDNHTTETAQDNHATVVAQDNHATVVAQDNHATVVAQAERKSVVFLGPHSRYSRADIAWFEGSHAEELVKRRIAVWPKDAERALKPKPGDSDFDTDIG